VTHLHTVHDWHDEVSISVEGIVETWDTAGVLGMIPKQPPPRCAAFGATPRATACASTCTSKRSRSSERLAPSDRGALRVTYCVSLFLREGLVMLSDTRTNAAPDNIFNFRKMHVIEPPGDRALALLTAGNFIEGSPDTPFLQIGEHKYGKPILDRALTHATPLDDGVKLVLIGAGGRDRALVLPPRDDAAGGAATGSGRSALNCFRVSASDLAQHAARAPALHLDDAAVAGHAARSGELARLHPAREIRIADQRATHRQQIEAFVDRTLHRLEPRDAAE
jgi:hypothetical protein